MSFITATSGATAVLAIGGTVAANVVPGINWKLTYDPKLKDISNFRDGRSKKDTLPDGSVTLRLIWDASNPATKASGFNLRAAATVTAYCFVDATNYFVLPGIVGPIGPENPGLEDVVGMDVTIEYSNGTFVYPANG